MFAGSPVHPCWHTRLRVVLGGGLLTATLVLASACQGAQAAAQTQPPATSESSAPATTPDRLNGTVQTVEGTKVMLTDGSSFDLAPETRVTRSSPATPADLRAGEFAAITAQLQPDGTLLASVVNIFPVVPSPTFLGQFPMNTGDLMTNAEIVNVGPAQSNEFSVKFPGGDQEIRLAPGAQMNKIVVVDPAEIVAGASVMATVVDGVARSVSLRS